MTVAGLNIIRNLWSALIDAGELGTGSTQETKDDTDLEAGIAVSETVRIETTTVDQFLKKEATFVGTSASSEALREMIWKKQSTDKAASRVTFPEVAWQTDRDTIIETRWFFRGRK